MYLPQALDTSIAAATLESRQIGGGNYRYRTRRRSPWTRWGRWVLAGVIILIGILLLIAFCVLSRRRRARQQKLSTQTPMSNYAPNNTGPGPIGTDNNNYGYNNNNQYNNQPGAFADSALPKYGGQQQQQQQYGGGAANDYYGGQQQSGISQPGGAYVR